MRLSLKKVGITFCGLIVPLLIALAATPLLLLHLGPNHYGILAICWGIIGYAGILDFGVSRAVIQRIASGGFELLPTDMAEIIGTARRLSTAIGVALGIIGIAAWTVAEKILTPDPELTGVALLICLALPSQSLFSLHRGILEAKNKFGTVAALRVIGSLLSIFGPLSIAIIDNSLFLIILTVVAGRWAMAAVAATLAFRAIQLAGLPCKYSASQARKIMGFGSWAMLSSVAGLIFSQTDRLFIAQSIGADAVTSYAIPYDLVTQTTILVSALSTVLFPWLSGKFLQDQILARQALQKTLIIVGIVMGLTLLSLAILAPKIVQVWLGEQASHISIDAWQILCLGVFFNSLAVILFASAHARGQARHVALSHLVQIPIYLAALTYLVKMYGVPGAAAAWTIRTLIDLFLLIIITRKDTLGCKNKSLPRTNINY